MTIQLFLQNKITWLFSRPGVERSFNNQYARVLKKGQKGKIKKIFLPNAELEPFFETKEFAYYTTRENVEKHKREGDL